MNLQLNRRDAKGVIKYGTEPKEMTLNLWPNRLLQKEYIARLDLYLTNLDVEYNIKRI
jgi:hypothetical protein